MDDAREIADRIVNHWIQFKNLGDSDLIDAIEVALLAERDRCATLKWLVERDGNLHLHETFCATSYDDDVACDCRIAKVAAAIRKAKR